MTHPYKSIGNYARWSRAMAAPHPGDVDPVINFPFVIDKDAKIVTAGSCFAQHIARYLSNSGFNHFITEPGHSRLPIDVREKHHYGLFSARYGNIYSSRQLLQLFQRAFWRFTPQDTFWKSDDRFVDPYRPTIQPGNFHSVEELEVDREIHLKCVRRALKQLDVFVFTLGLTETWCDRADGAAYPLCPGVEGGVFDADRHTLINLTVEDVVADMTEALGFLRRVNRKSKVILTVSPVPLAATAVDRHVLVSTTMSKSILRVAAQILADSVPDVTYFPSYEIITGPHARGAYFAPDLRSVTDAGVDHVMRLFFKHATVGAVDASALRNDIAETREAERIANAVTEAMCEEALLDQ